MSKNKSNDLEELPIKIDVAKRDSKQALDDEKQKLSFDEKYAGKVQAITTAGQNIDRGIDSLKNGVQQLMAGDEYGGSASLLDGIGALSNVAALAGAGGAVVGLVMSFITGLISAILQALMPQKESLEAMI